MKCERMFRKRWFWYFVILFILASAGVLIPIIYNLSIQLTSEKFQAAKKQWDQDALSDYDLKYLVRINDQRENYYVEVRNGEISSVKFNDHPLSADHPNAFTVTSLFALIENNLQQDQQPANKRNFATAFFHQELGYPIRYVRVQRNDDGKERLEINAKLIPLNNKDQ